MLPTIEPVARLVEEFARLPGIGPKTAQRLTFYLLRMPPDFSRGLAEAILRMRESVCFCSICANITEVDPCALCASPGRDQGLLCIVEEPLDALALERTGMYKGVYHVLHGALSPVDGIGPDQLKVAELLGRLQRGGIREAILATNADVEGEATAMYLVGMLRPFGVRVTRLARGLPMGGDLEYADEVTLIRALEGRSAMG